MTFNKFLLVGFGSMGKRRARLLKEIDDNITLIVVDSNEERRTQAIEMGYCAFASIDDAPVGDVCGALVCSAPLSHPEITKKLLSLNLHVFNELNLTDESYHELQSLAQQNKLCWFNSNTMLYRKEINKIIQRRKDFKKPVSYNYHIGQYLPDWHPWESYKNFFVGDKRTSGIREILAIELAWLTSCFGKAECVSVNRRMLSSLEIGYDDTVITVLSHEDGTLGVLVADVVSPKPVREFELFGEGLHLFWEGSPSTLFEYNTEKKEKVNLSLYENATQLSGYSDNIVEDAYKDELLDFLSAIKESTCPRYEFEHNIEVLRLIEEIERR